MVMPHRCEQFAGRSGRVLVKGHVIGAARLRRQRFTCRHTCQPIVIGHHCGHARARHEVASAWRHQHECRLAVCQSQPHAFRSEQREHRHHDRTGLDDAENRGVKRQRRVQHHRDPVSPPDPASDQVTCDARTPVRQLRERKGLIAAIGMGDANCGTGLIFAVCVSIDALVRDVQCVARAIEQVPQSGSTGVFLSVGEKREISREVMYSPPQLAAGMPMVAFVIVKCVKYLCSYKNV
jgi:hypothetical protein